MTQFVARLLLALVILGGVSQAALAQVPRRGTEPVTPTDPNGAPPVPVREPSVAREPTVAPPLPSADPAIAAPQPAVQPGTIQPQRVLRASREIMYLPAGEAPGAVQVTATEPRTVTLSWTAPAGAIGYWVKQAGPGQTAYYSGGSQVTGTSALVTSLRPATTYSFKVAAMYPPEMQRAEGVSAPLAATTAAAPVPSGFTASVVGRGAVSLSWAALPGADGFRVLRNDTTLKDIKRLANYPLATTVADSVLPGTHRYSIQAVYRAAGIDQGPDVLSAPSPPAAVTIPASSRVRFCQTRAGAARCAEPDSPTVTIASRTLP